MEQITIFYATLVLTASAVILHVLVFIIKTKEIKRLKAEIYVRELNSEELYAEAKEAESNLRILIEQHKATIRSLNNEIDEMKKASKDKEEQKKESKAKAIKEDKKVKEIKEVKKPRVKKTPKV